MRGKCNATHCTHILLDEEYAVIQSCQRGHQGALLVSGNRQGVHPLGNLVQLCEVGQLVADTLSHIHKLGLKQRTKSAF